MKLGAGSGGWFLISGAERVFHLHATVTISATKPAVGARIIAIPTSTAISEIVASGRTPPHFAAPAIQLSTAITRPSTGSAAMPTGARRVIAAAIDQARKKGRRHFVIFISIKRPE